MRNKKTTSKCSDILFVYVVRKAEYRRISCYMGGDGNRVRRIYV